MPHCTSSFSCTSVGNAELNKKLDIPEWPEAGKVKWRFVTEMESGREQERKDLWPLYFGLRNLMFFWRTVNPRQAQFRMKHCMTGVSMGTYQCGAQSSSDHFPVHIWTWSRSLTAKSLKIPSMRIVVAKKLRRFTKAFLWTSILVFIIILSIGAENRS